ncbi:hypothetical protein COB55_00270 [Candidatus Wolfebacteria bacterium]|nr:MAG: hypothetical protein COB55_00270 [Candidatus Wolfebacteria bacterium]
MNEEDKVTYFAKTDARNKQQSFGIKAKDRTKHVYVIGKTGMGKSTLLENMAVQDIQNGNGFAFIDPHGQTAELLLDYIPEERRKDVLYFAPFDTDNPISFNVMEDVGPDKRHLVLAGLMSTFKKIWVDVWSARMEYILSNTILALLEYPDSTLLSVNRMLSDKAYRKKVVDNVTDVSVKSFWIDEFAKYTERMAAESTPAIQNKIGQFTGNPIIRNIIGQPHSSFDLREIMDKKKIVIINLSKGLVGESNANLLGSMLITKIYLAAMSRADVTPARMKELPNFYLYVDEFQSFANETFADILSEARKYKLNLTMAHQYIEQMTDEVRAAVFGNVGTMIAFRVGATDAEVFEKEFAPQFTGEDLVNLGKHQIYLRLMIDGIGSLPFSATTLPPIAVPETSSTESVIAASREQFGNKRAEVEEKILASLSNPVTDKNSTTDGKSDGSESGEKKEEVTDLRKRDAEGNVIGSTKNKEFEKSQKTGQKPTEKAEEKSVDKKSLGAVPVKHTKVENKIEAKVEKPLVVVPVKHTKVEKKIETKVEEEQNKITKTPPPSNNKDGFSPLSLGSLKGTQEHKSIEKKVAQRKDDKKPSEGNLSSLREALNSAMKNDAYSNSNTKKEIPESAKTHSQSHTTKPNHKNVPHNRPKENSQAHTNTNTNTNRNEVPEDVLRNTLRVDGE